MKTRINISSKVKYWIEYKRRLRRFLLECRYGSTNSRKKALEDFEKAAMAKIHSLYTARF